MATVDTIIVSVILIFIMLIIWSKIMGQRMLDTLNEIKDFITGLFKHE